MNGTTATDRQKLKVAILSPYATVIPHFETELDIAQQHLDAGDEVSHFYCAGGLANCDFNPAGDAQRCTDCLLRRQMGLELLAPQPNSHHHAEFKQLAGSTNVATDRPPLETRFDSVEELIAYELDGFDIGYAVLSSVVSLCRDPEPQLTAQRELVERFLRSAYDTYWQTLDYLRGRQLDRVYVFNGRFASVRAVFRACQKMGVDCYLHERGCDLGHYELFKNHLPHDLVEIEKEILRHWAANEHDTTRESLAEQWFIDRVARVERGWHSFTKSQEQGRMPLAWDESCRNLAIFCSSDDEFVAIGKEWQNELYPNQVEAISRLAADMLQAQPATKIYLRVHPNLAEVDNQRKRSMLALDFPNLTVIPPTAPIDTYALMKACDTVVSFGSSVGSEAIYWGRPSVLLGPCFYQNLGGVYRARTHQEAIELLSTELQPRSRDGALKYGFWLQTRGKPHKHYLASDFYSGQFKGELLYARQPPAPSRLKQFKRRLKLLIKR